MKVNPLHTANLTVIFTLTVPSGVCCSRNLTHASQSQLRGQKHRIYESSATTDGVLTMNLALTRPSGVCCKTNQRFGYSQYRGSFVHDSVADTALLPVPLTLTIALPVPLTLTVAFARAFDSDCCFCPCL